MQPDGAWVGRGTHQAGLGVAMVVELFKFIHPHFSCADTVGQSLVAGVGSLPGENVANVRTRVCLQGPPALPDLYTERGGGVGWGVSGKSAAGPQRPEQGGWTHGGHGEHCQGLTLHGAGGHSPSILRTQDAVKEQESSPKDN